MTTPKELCACVIHALEDIKGKEIKMLEVSELTTITDYMVICTATSSRQLQALANNVVKAAKEKGIRPYNYDFQNQTEWALVDLGDVIAHIMLAETRDYYAIEKLWTSSDAEDEA